MPRTHLLLAALALGLVATPLAAAQQTSSTLVMVLDSPGGPVEAEKALVFQGTATYVAEAAAQTSLTGIQVTYTVANAPEWASVTVSPQSDVFTFSQPALSPTVTATKAFTVTVIGTPDGVDGATGAIEIQGVTAGTLLVRAAWSNAAVPVLYEAGDEECAEAGAEVAPLLPPQEGAADEAPQEDDGLTVQSGGPAVPAALPIAGVAGFAALGAGVGLFLRKRRV